jgi:acetoin utilization protein AcuC
MVSRPAFVTHPVFRRPAFGVHHPLSTARQAAVEDLCEVLGWFDAASIVNAAEATRETLLRFHERDYVDAVIAASAAGIATPEQRLGYNLGSMECPVFPGLFERAATTVGGAIKAAELALTGRIAFFPAGGTHHGRPGRASGFCYFNDPVFALLTLLHAGLERVAYVDFDAHHGDGVEAAFANDPRVALASLHEVDLWPGTGQIDDKCGGRALNIPLPRGITDSEYRLMCQRVVFPFLQRWRPDAIAIVLGADGLAGDPLSAMQLSNTTLWDMTMATVALAPRAVILGGGGYNPWTTSRLWAGMWARLTGKLIPSDLPAAVQEILQRLTCDLVDDEDRDPAWITRLADASSNHPIRPEIEALTARLTR